MQDAGFYIIPRVEYFICRREGHMPEDTPGLALRCEVDKGPHGHHPLCPKNYAFHYMPLGATPVVSTQMRTDIEKEFIKPLQDALIESVDYLQPEQFLIYASKKGRKLVEDIRDKLHCEIVLLPTVDEVRRKLVKRKETDPAILELKKRKRPKEHDRVWSEDK
jgi:hypothetical protein